MRKLVIHPNFDDLQDAIAAIPDNFDSLGILVYSGRNQVRIIHSNRGDLAVKRYKPSRFIDKIGYVLGKKTKGHNAYAAARRIIDRGFDTPEPVAYIVDKKFFIPYQSYYICRAISSPSLKEVLADNINNKALLDEIAVFIKDIHIKGIMHGDLNLSNVHYADGHFSLIDINRTYFYVPDACHAAHNIMRLSTRRDIVTYIARKYAVLRGFDVNTFVKLVIREQLKFRRNKTIRHNISRRLGMRK